MLHLLCQVKRANAVETHWVHAVCQTTSKSSHNLNTHSYSKGKRKKTKSITWMVAEDRVIKRWTVSSQCYLRNLSGSSGQFVPQPRRAVVKWRLKDCNRTAIGSQRGHWRCMFALDVVFFFLKKGVEVA